MKKGNQRNTLKNIQRRLFLTQMILILTLAIFLGSAGILLNIYFENQKRDQNLQNVAEAIAQSPLAVQSDEAVLGEYLDTLKESLGDIDVISVVNTDNTRRYHSDHLLIGSVYDGTQPQFDANKQCYTASDEGPSGTQRRAYAAILRFAEKLRQAGIQGFCLGYGGCPLCEPCKRAENQPCSHPDKKISCMSAYCIDVAKLAEKCGLEFAWLPEKLFLFGMFVFM